QCAGRVSAGAIVGKLESVDKRIDPQTTRRVWLSQFVNRARIARTAEGCRPPEVSLAVDQQRRRRTVAVGAVGVEGVERYFRPSTAWRNRRHQFVGDSAALP